MNFFKRFFGSRSRPTPPLAPLSAAVDSKPPVRALNVTSGADSACYDLFISYSRRDNRNGNATTTARPYCLLSKTCRLP
jgi:hypothetical protein